MYDLDIYGDPCLSYLYGMDEANPKDGCLGFGITIAALIAVLFLTIFLGSCRAGENVVKERRSDSVRVEVRERNVYVPDTVLVKIPLQAAERETADSTSHLENDYAVSEARINPDGRLIHTLETKPQEKPVPVLRVVEIRDSIVYVDREATATENVLIEKPFAWWEKALMVAGCITVLLAAFLVWHRLRFGRPLNQ